MFKLASWNVNSLKIRLDQVLTWLEKSNVDVLALQETKLLDEHFPLSIFQERGLHAVFSGQKTYNGVAILSKFPLEEVMTDMPAFADPQRRMITATVAGVRLINLYIPNGAVVGSDKYSYKLTWLHNITLFIKEQMSRFAKIAVVGDFNIAPEDRDVHSPEAWAGSVMVSPEERAAFAEWMTLGLKDSFRNFEQDPTLFSWWDYRAGSFRRNHGLRIDHILLNKELNDLCKESSIDIEPRRCERPSDHAPVWVTLDV